MHRFAYCLTSTAFALALLLGCAPAPEQDLAGVTVTQLTSGPESHFYGYIGHVGNTPWSGDDRYMAALRIQFIDRMPTAEDAADIVLIDTRDGNSIRKIEETRAWNPQQGTMLYWNPVAPSTQFFFNDRDPETGRIFCVLYDVEEQRRVREYRFDDTPVGNGGVAQQGGSFAAINYGRMARLRPVTGYPEAYDWNPAEAAPEDDGVFVVDVETGEKKLIVSFAQMRDLLAERHPQILDTPLFINHTLWNRDNDRIFFFVRGNFGSRDTRVNVPMTVRPDGSELTEQTVFIGGHPEWELGSNMIGAVGDDLVLYDTDAQQIVDTLGDPTIFPDPEGDTALSPDGEWIVNGHTDESIYGYTIYDRTSGEWFRSPDFDRTGYEHGELRIDPAPRWNRAGDRVAVPGLAEDGTRQMFLLEW